jgi:hypothetical protein
MESTKKKAGRPKSEAPKGPLVLEGTQKRETILTEVSMDTAQELGAYAAWVKELAPAKMTSAEATSKTIDFALRDLFARDKRWQEKKRPAAQSAGADESAPPAPPPSVPTSPSTPVSRTAPVPSALPPPGGRDGRTGSQTGS